MEHAEDMFLLTKMVRPVRFRTKCQNQFFDGPRGRRDAEEALRSKWLEILGGVFRSTNNQASNAFQHHRHDVELDLLA